MRIFRHDLLSKAGVCVMRCYVNVSVSGSVYCAFMSGVFVCGCVCMRDVFMCERVDVWVHVCVSGEGTTREKCCCWYETRSESAGTVFV